MNILVPQDCLLFIGHRLTMCRVNDDAVFMSTMRRSAVSIQIGQCISPRAFILKRTQRGSYPYSSCCADDFTLNTLAS